MTPSVILPLCTQNNDVYRVRTLLDSGSSSSWISKDVLEYIDFASKGKVRVKVFHFEGTKAKRFEVVQIYILYRDEKIPIDCFVMENFTFHKMVPNIKQFLRRNTRLPECIIKDIVNPDSDQVDHKSLNLGTALILSNTDKIKILSNTPKNIILKEQDMIIEDTKFGYSVSGRIPEQLRKESYELQANVVIPVLSFNVTIDGIEDDFFQGFQATLSPEYDSLDNLVRITWEKELSLGVLKNETHTDDERARQIFKDGVRFDIEQGQFSTPLPFNGKEIFLQTNERQARLRTVRQNLLMVQNEQHLTGGMTAFQKMKDIEAIELVTPEMEVGEIVHYLPWRFVVKESETTSYRMCMDASAKPKKGDMSLNQCLLQGPNMTLNLAKCLIRFTLGKIRIVSDIEKAFLMISIWVSHRDCLRFFWPESPGDPRSKLLIYRFRVVLFGSISSPFLLAAVLEKIIEEDIKEKEIQTILKDSIYVDNLNAAVNCVNTAKAIYISCRETFLKRHFNFRQWSSNCKQLNELAIAEGVEDDRKEISVLGKLWCEGDVFAFKEMKKWCGAYTKWATLSFGNAPFDPTGELIPVIIQIRSFLRELWNLKLGWKDDYSDKTDLVKRFDELRHETEIVMKRRSPVGTVVTPETEIHIFSDASNSAIGAVMYLVTPRCETCPDGHVKQLFSKGKLTPPLKDRSKIEDTIPRWELLGILISAQIASFVTSDIKELQDKRIFIWGDSKVALAWCSSDDLKDNFVIRRVTDIRKLVPTGELRYVNTKENPADIITRKISGKDLLDSTLWWEGPEWLMYKEKWPKYEEEYNLQTEWTKEVQMSIANVSKSKETPIFGTLSLFFDRYDFVMAIRCLRWPLRWRDGKQSKPRENSVLKSLSKKYNYSRFPINNEQYWGYDEKMYVIQEVYKIMQAECFKKELVTLKQHKLVKFGPCRSWGLYLDNNNIIRCGNYRLPETIKGLRALPPILVHGDHPMIKSFLLNYHIKWNCLSENNMVNNIKSSMHGIKLMLKIKQTVKSCARCAVKRAVPYGYPSQPKLPLERLQARRPFSCVGVDYSGPHWVRDRYQRKKVWVALFTCLVTRGVYLVKVQSCSIVDFVNSLYSLMTRRGQPELLLSDNATNFTGTANLLKNFAKSKEAIKTLTEHNIKWEFLPPDAPWQGGSYERLIGLMKQELMKMTRNGQFPESEFEKHLLEVEFIMNSRPLCSVGEGNVITPAHFLNSYNNMETEINSVDREKFLEEVLIIRNELPDLFKQVQRLREQFWQSLWAQYLDKLRFSRDKKKNRFAKVPKVGEVCIIWQDGPRHGWKKGVILELIKSEDLKIRSCKVQTKNGIIVRPVNLLYSLEMSELDTESRSYYIDKAIAADSQLDPMEQHIDLPQEHNELPQEHNDVPQEQHEEVKCRKAKLEALGKIHKVNDYEKSPKKRVQKQNR